MDSAPPSYQGYRYPAEIIAHCVAVLPLPVVVPRGRGADARARRDRLPRDRPPLTRRIQFRARPSTRDLRHEFFHALGLPGRPPSHAIEFDRMLRGALEEPRVLVCDETQWLSKPCFEYLHHLWDDTASDLTIVFTGGNGCFEMLQREPMPVSRVYARQEVGRIPLGLNEILTVIPPFPPVWTEVDPDLITVCDQEAAYGNFRTWAKITHHLTTGLRETGRKRVDEELPRWTYSKLSTRQPV